MLYQAPFKALHIGKQEIKTCEVNMMAADYNPAAELKKQVEELEDEKPKIYVFHPGYLDMTITKMSSLTTGRIKEVAALRDPATKEMLDKNKVECISYATVSKNQ